MVCEPDLMFWRASYTSFIGGSTFKIEISAMVSLLMPQPNYCYIHTERTMHIHPILWLMHAPPAKSWYINFVVQSLIIEIVSIHSQKKIARLVNSFSTSTFWEVIVLKHAKLNCINTFNSIFNMNAKSMAKTLQPHEGMWSFWIFEWKDSIFMLIINYVRKYLIMYANVLKSVNMHSKHFLANLHT